MTCNLPGRDYRYTAEVRWDENDENMSKAVIFLYDIQYKSGIQTEWQSQRVDGIGRGFVKLAPGATYEFRVVGVSAKGFTKPSDVATQKCTY